MESQTQKQIQSKECGTLLYWLSYSSWCSHLLSCSPRKTPARPPDLPHQLTLPVPLPRPHRKLISGAPFRKLKTPWLEEKTCFLRSMTPAQVLTNSNAPRNSIPGTERPTCCLASRKCNYSNGVTRSGPLKKRPRL